MLVTSVPAWTRVPHHWVASPDVCPVPRNRDQRWHACHQHSERETQLRLSIFLAPCWQKIDYGHTRGHDLQKSLDTPHTLQAALMGFLTPVAFLSDVQSRCCTVCGIFQRPHPHSSRTAAACLLHHTLANLSTAVLQEASRQRAARQAALPRYFLSRGNANDSFRVPCRERPVSVHGQDWSWPSTTCSSSSPGAVPS